MKHRINEALIDLAKKPPFGDIVKLQGEDGYRRRVGDYGSSSGKKKITHIY